MHRTQSGSGGKSDDVLAVRQQIVGIGHALSAQSFIMHRIKYDLTTPIQTMSGRFRKMDTGIFRPFAPESDYD